MAGIILLILLIVEKEDVSVLIHPLILLLVFVFT